MFITQATDDFPVEPVTADKKKFRPGLTATLLKRFFVRPEIIIFSLFASYKAEEPPAAMMKQDKHNADPLPEAARFYS